MTARIVGVDVERRRVALPRPWGPDAPENTVVAVRVRVDDGTHGVGFGWTPTVGSRALEALVEDDVAGVVVGAPAHPVVVHRLLARALHEGGTGLATAAAASVDLALWDREATLAGRGLPDHLGRMRDDAPAYGSGVNLHYPIDELVAQVQRWVDAGFDAVKVKVGKPDVAEDVDRIDAVRSVLGPRRRLMIDANQRWDLAHAQRAVRVLSRFDLDWIEEPLRADDVRSLARLRSRIDVPIACGENAHAVERFVDLVASDAVDVVQPNVVRVGGITPFLRIVEIAESSSVVVAPHLLPDVSAQLALTLPREAWVEVVEDASLDDLGLLSTPSPVHVGVGRARVDAVPGLGIRPIPF